MFDRENLNVEWADCLPISESVYVAAEADKVMDRLESYIKELETNIKELKAENEQLKIQRGKLCGWIQSNMDAT